MKKRELMTKLFGKAASCDERVMAANTKAGALGFGIVMIALYGGMIYGLVAKREETMLTSFAGFMIGCVVYLVGLVRYGAVGDAFPLRKRSTAKTLASVVGSSLSFFGICLGLSWLISPSQFTVDAGRVFLQWGIAAVLFGPTTYGLNRALAALGERRLRKLGAPPEGE